MSKPDWTEAPEGATHWDTRGAVWCKHLYFWYYGRWNYEGEIHDLAEDRYTPRPVEAWFPIVGERCQVIELPGIYIECEILANRCGDYIYYVPEKHAYGMLAAGAFRPIRTQAQREREEAIEKALAMDCHPREGTLSRHDFCGALYDAGMLRRVGE